MTSPDPTPIYLDCDTGIDDALAIALLLAASRSRLAGIGTVSGNVHAAQAARNTLDLLDLGGAGDVPVAIGAHHPLAGPFGGGAPQVHGSNGIGGVELPRSPHEPLAESAAELLVRLARRHPQRLDVIAIGPLTNLALALSLEPELPTLVRSLTVMGGAFDAPGNVTRFAEANIASDPEAAARVVAAPWPVTIVPLDVTMAHRFDAADQLRLSNSDRAVYRAVARTLDAYFDFYLPIFGDRSAALHDPLAVAVALGLVTPDRVLRGTVQVDAGAGERRGALLLRESRDGASGADATVVVSVPESSARVILEHLLGDEDAGSPPAAGPDASAAATTVAVPVAAAMQRLTDRARDAAAHAHAPYSRFPVGAAIEFANGVIATGANVENSSYPLGMCAERAAVSAGISAGGDTIVRVAVVSASGDAPPCGGCRQALSEFAAPSCEVSFGWGATRTTVLLSDLLPYSFFLNDWMVGERA